jgi:hypothetical protein
VTDERWEQFAQILVEESPDSAEHVFIVRLA